jgi:hypothetical protein
LIQAAFPSLIISYEVINTARHIYSTIGDAAFLIRKAPGADFRGLAIAASKSSAIINPIEQT